MAEILDIVRRGPSVVAVTVLLTIGGVIAALILFRWARFLAMLALVLTAAWFFSRFQAWDATQPPVHIEGRL